MSVLNEIIHLQTAGIIHNFSTIDTSFSFTQINAMNIKYILKSVRFQYLLMKENIIESLLEQSLGGKYAIKCWSYQTKASNNRAVQTGRSV